MFPFINDNKDGSSNPCRIRFPMICEKKPSVNCIDQNNEKDCNINNSCYWNKEKKCEAQCNIMDLNDCHNDSKSNNKNCVIDKKKTLSH